MQLYPTAAALPGVERLTAHLAAHGVPMAIATSSSAAAVAAKRKGHAALFSRFNALVTAEDIRNGKPAPDVFVEAARRLGCAPADCLVFEDAESGLQSGLAAGAVVIAVPDVRLHEDLAPFGRAHEVLRSLHEFQPQRWGLPPLDEAPSSA